MGAFWVIGDIHGVYDPLNLLLKQIKYFEDENLMPEKADKIIFLGDYIDHGPSSREVIDLLLELDMETVFLAGNHEDFLLHFLNATDIYEQSKNSWFFNGGVNTLMSFAKNQEDINFFIKYANALEKGSYEAIYEIVRNKIKTWDKKYLNFFTNLIYGYKQKLIIKNKEFNFVFMHGGYMPNNKKYDYIGDFKLSKEDIEEQAKERKFEEYTQFWKSKNISIEENTIWSRYLYEYKIENYILIHGHTPIFYYRDDEIPENQPKDRPLFHSKEKINPYIYDKEINLNNLISINMDTGAVYGKALSALYISSKHIEENEEVVTLSINTATGYRRRGIYVNKIKVKV